MYDLNMLTNLHNKNETFPIITPAIKLNFFGLTN